MRVLCVPSAVGFAHLGRLLLIAGRLAERGHKMTFAYGGAHGAEIEAAGHACLGVHDVGAPDPEANVYAAWSAAEVERALESLAAAIATVRADVVVADFHPAATLAAERAGVPSAGVVPFELAPGFDPASLFRGRRRLASRAARGIFGVRSRSLAGPFDDAARRLGLTRRRTLADVFRGDATLVAELEGFAPALQPAPGQRCVGPLVWEERGGPPPPPAAGTARVYATIGNTGRRELLEMVADALGGLSGIDVVLTSGRYAAPAGAGAPNVHSYAQLPGTEVMRRSRLAIHCGGRGTTYQALAAGIPSIVVPYVSGQHSTARLVTGHGVGIGFRPERVNPFRLRLGAQQLIVDGAARERAREFQRLIAAADGPGAAAAAIEDLAGA